MAAHSGNRADRALLGSMMGYESLKANDDHNHEQ
jgi:hypothetical protein